MKVLSLFDGVACGMLAFKRAGIQVDRYVAYEINESAIKIAKHNFQEIEERGDVFQADFTEFKGFDAVIGGSPCTFWSCLQRSGTRETTPEGMGWTLFQQYVRAIHEVKPRFFIYENNKSMPQTIREEISKEFGFDAICIDSALVSCQMRKRLYWVGIRQSDGTYRKADIDQPEDRGVMLKDILESGHVDRDKGLCLARRYAGFTGSQSYLCRRYFGKHICQAVFEGDIDEIRQRWKNDPYFESDEHNIRSMTMTEIERYQTLPDGYTDVDGVSNTERIEAIGNGWTVDVISHILSSVMKEVGE